MLCVDGCVVLCLGSGRSELDELQEEVVRRARQQEQQRRREAEREAAMGFNPKPSKYMDLDQLQHQGTDQSGAEGQGVQEVEKVYEIIVKRSNYW